MKKLFPFLLALGLLLPLAELRAQAKVKSVPFTYIPDQSEDRYNQRLDRKTIVLNETGFIILSRVSATDYAVERYDADLKKLWTAAIPLTENETLQAFEKHANTALVLTHKVVKDQGQQWLFAHLVDLQTGKKQEPKKLFEAPSKSRRIGTAVSEDGSKIAAFQYNTDNQYQIQSIQASIFDANLNKLKDRSYDFRGLGSGVSAKVHIDNAGDQYVTLITNKATKLSVRRYTNNSTEIKVMEIPVGGTFGGRNVYVIDSRFKLGQDKKMYSAVFTADSETGDLYSLKSVMFDFGAEDMRFAEEFQFTPQYLADVNKLDKSGKPATRLEDIYLSDLLITQKKDLILIAEKKYTEGGATSDYHAKELHLFAYDEYMAPAWRGLIMKNQVASAEDAFSGISYRANLSGNNLQLLLFETLEGKTDLYLRTLDTHTGKAEAYKALGLNVANDKNIAYVKDFTAWLNDKTIISVVRPSKKGTGLQLSRISLK